MPKGTQEMYVVRYSPGGEANAKGNAGEKLRCTGVMLASLSLDPITTQPIFGEICGEMFGDILATFLSRFHGFLYV